MKLKNLFLTIHSVTIIFLIVLGVTAFLMLQNQFYLEQDRLTHAIVQQHDSRGYWLLAVIIGAIVLIAGISVTSFFIIKNRIIKQMEKLRIAKEKSEESEAKFKLMFDKNIKTKQALEKSKQLFKSTVNSLSEFMHVVDKDCNIILANEACIEQSRQLGFDTDMIGEKLTDVYPFLEDNVYEELNKVFASGEEMVTYEKNKLNNQEFYTEVKKTPVFDKGNVIRVITTVKDITDQITSQQELQKQNDEYYSLYEKYKTQNEELLRAKEKAEESEAKFKRLTENAQDMIFRMSLPKGEATYLNPAAARITGYTLKEIYNEPLFVRKIAHPDWLDYVNKEFNKLLSGGISSTYEYKIINKSGNEKWLYQRNVPIRNKKGILTAIEGIVTDITDLKKAEQALRESEEKYRTLIQNQGEGVGITNLNEEFIFANPAAERIFGVGKGELVGKNLIDFFDKEQFEIIQKETESRKQEQITTYDLTIKRFDNEKRYLIVTVTPQIDENGKVVGTMGIFRDITTRKKALFALEKAKREAEKAREEAETANRLKGEFLANMSHEIRTPLNAIIGFSSLLQGKLENEKHRSFIDIIIKNGNSFLELINGILELSKIEAGQLEIRKEPAYPHAIFNEVLPTFYKISKSKQIPLNLDIDKNLPDRLLIDSIHINQVLTNLIDNAFKFTEKGSISITVTTKEVSQTRSVSNQTREVLKTSRVWLETERVWSETERVLDLVIEVKDTGIGIAENQFDTIFQSFRQVDGQSTRKYSGTGLGLAIAKHLVRLMDGTITVESTVGVGSTFKVQLNNIKILDVEKDESIEKKETVEIQEVTKTEANISEPQKQKNKVNAFPEELKIIIKEELEPLHNKLLKVLSVDDLKIFVRRNKEVAEKYEIDFLHKYSDALQASITNFNLDKINKLQEYFPEIIKMICEE